MKRIVIFIVFIALILSVFSSCSSNKKTPEESGQVKDDDIIPSELSFEGKNINIRDIVLKIYCLPPQLLTIIPINIEKIINTCRFQINVSNLEIRTHSKEAEKLFYYVSKSKTDDDFYINARIYYVFETTDGEKIFDVTLWSDKGVVVNGKLVEDNPIFHEFIMPFLPVEIAETLNEMLLSNDSNK